jgi:hypothetical protein
MIVQVGVLAAQEGQRAGDAVRGEEERAPGLALADVDALVGAGVVEGGLVAAEDDVAEGHGGSAVGEEGAVFEEKGGEAAVDFEDAAVDAGAAAGEEGGMEEEEAEEGGGGGPEVEEEFFEGREDRG